MENNFVMSFVTGCVMTDDGLEFCIKTNDNRYFIFYKGESIELTDDPTRENSDTCIIRTFRRFVKRPNAVFRYHESMNLLNGSGKVVYNFETSETSDKFEHKHHV